MENLEPTTIVIDHKKIIELISGETLYFGRADVYIKIDDKITYLDILNIAARHREKNT